jgi:hypothetical protein
MKIPLLSTPDRPITASTQSLVPVADIIDGVVLFKDGGACLILESTSLNFNLLSEIEKEAVIASYAGLLNSFNFPVQIVVRSQKKDITIYMDYIVQEEKKLKNQKLLHIMEDYRKFIFESIKKKNVLSKKFYIVIPFSPYELGIGIRKTITNVFIKQQVPSIPYPKSYVLRKAKITLYPKREHLIRQAARLGVRFRQLQTDEVVDLLFNLYNIDESKADKNMEIRQNNILL